MKLRTVKKALRAWAEERYTPLFKVVRLDDITYFEYYRKTKRERNEARNRHTTLQGR